MFLTLKALLHLVPLYRILVYKGLLQRLKNGWIEAGVIWLAIVGRAGVGKTHNIKAITRPLTNRNAKEIKRKTAKMNRTPAWLTEDDFWLIEQAYDLAAKRTQMFKFSWHVDHIIPLQGKIVSGLHVPLNLQVIPASINTSKQNKFEVLNAA